MFFNEVGNNLDRPLAPPRNFRTFPHAHQGRLSQYRYDPIYFYREFVTKRFDSLASPYSTIWEPLCQSFQWHYYGNTLLHYAALYQKGSIKPTELNENLIDAINCYGETPLILASKVDNLPFVKSLIKSGADITITDLNGKNALHHAAESLKTVDIAKHLIESGLEPSSLDREGNSGIHLSARSGYLDMLKLFQDRQVPFDEYNYKGYTPLMFATLNEKVDIVQYLILQGADMAKRSDVAAISAFDCALKQSKEKIIDLFIKKGVKSLPRLPEVSKPKNAATLLFEKIIRNIDKVEFKYINDGKGRNKIIVIMDEVNCPILDIFREVQWESIHLTEQDYESRISRLSWSCSSDMKNIDSVIESNRKIRYSTERPEDREALKIKFQENYKDLNNFDKYMLYRYTGILSRHMNEVLSGSNKNAHEINIYRIILDIGFVANALNKLKPEPVGQFTCRGQADIYKINNNTPLFVSFTQSYYTAKLYATCADIVKVEGRGHGHLVFFKHAEGYDISGLSSAPLAKELVSLPKVISYTDECFTYNPNSGVTPYYFGTLNKATSFSASL